MPKAYEEANDGLGTSATAATMAKMASGQGFGYSTTVGGASVSIGYSDNLGASTDRTDGGQDTTATSVDSSSGRSKGNLFVSANAEIKKIMNIGNNGIANHTVC